MPDKVMEEMCQTELRQIFGRFGPKVVDRQLHLLYDEWKDVLLPQKQVQFQNSLETPTVVWERDRLGTFDAKTGVRIPKPDTCKVEIPPHWQSDVPKPVLPKQQSTLPKSDEKPDAGTKKATHKQAIADKRADLESKGVDPLSFLTEQNLREWLLSGTSFAQIAEQTGNDDTVVSVTAKQYGLESKIQKLIRAKRSLQQSGF